MCECAQLPSIHIPGPVFFGFLHPHFYISKHPNFDITTDKEDWLACISARLQAENRKTRGRVLDVSLEKRRSIYYYHEDEEEYMKLTLQFPADVTSCRTLLAVGPTTYTYIQKGIAASDFKNYRARERAKQLGQPVPPPPAIQGVNLYKHEIFEAKLPFVLRFMVDNGIVGCNWLQVDPGKYRLLSAGEKVATCTRLHRSSRRVSTRRTCSSRTSSRTPRRETSRTSRPTASSPSISSAVRRRAGFQSPRRTR